MTKEQLGARLEELRRRAGLSRAALEAAAGVPAGSVEHWERGREPGALALLALAAALGVPADELGRPPEGGVPARRRGRPRKLDETPSVG